MRGQLSLFQDLFTTTPVVTPKQRPRNFYLPERNEALLNRYYYYAEIHRYRYDDCIAFLEREFYITAPRIVAVISSEANRLSEIVKKKPTIAQLAKEFPHFNWKAKR